MLSESKDLVYSLFLPIGSFLKIGKGIFRLLLPVIAKASFLLLIPDFL
jgi:hypothetical protein